MTTRMRRRVAAIVPPDRRQRLRNIRDRVVNPEIAGYLRLLRAADGPPPLDVVVLGDSSWIWTARQDLDHRDLSAMFDAQLPPAVTRHHIRGGGYHPGLHAVYLQALVDSGRPLPPVVVGPVNVRTFGPQWTYHPDYRFDTALARIRRAARSRHPRLVWTPVAPPPRSDLTTTGAILHRSMFGPTRTLAEYRRLVGNTARDQETKATGAAYTERKRMIFEYHYGAAADRTSERLAQLGALGRVVRDAGSVLVAYSSPINIEGGVELLGPTFRSHILGQVAMAREALEQTCGNAIRWIDAVDALPASAFFHRYEASEHLAEEGRRWLSDKLAAAAFSALAKSRR
ncbi:MAG: hypothetical protein JOY57_19205 [Actinobacteria bacterium]|nr:hypothetical protein [Actinomycetota bacterium]MBV8960547.1 hypothetical protein [Actinomycetota bacterium]